jgi:phosphatidylserine/phosphatidylglycerophosphate/cardiolipin synthase-like enzyme/uncharacterized membrane protein YdjX (TVP38/TMEM64 family)
MQEAILKEGRNCWRKVPAKRVAFLIDGANYFAAFRTAVEQAQRSILIIGWDIDSRVHLIPDKTSAKWPVQLGGFLNAIVQSRPHLHANILTWDFAMIYALEREPLPLYKLHWRTHRRLHFCLDGKHPIGASHHQKIVVIDDALAFVGGLDLTKCRWDTSAHLANDPRRVTSSGESYQPFHDVQMMVDGEAAATLGALARERWRRATGKQLPPADGKQYDPWPSDIQPAMRAVEVAIARTEPAYDGHPPVREVENLYVDAIAAARHAIYIENQYLTSATVGKALVNRLQEDNGPDIVIVLPCETGGWLEQSTMDVLRARLLKILQKADQHGRLCIYYPDAPGLGKNCIIVHDKLLIIDDTLLRIGSANLSNRSMGLDTECDLAMEAHHRADLKQAIANLRNRLLAEHLSTEPDQVAQAILQKNSLIAAVESLRSGGRTLRKLENCVPELLEQALPDATLIDPERPLDPEALIAQLMPEPTEENNETSGELMRHPWLKGLAILGILLALAAAWRWTPLGEWLDAQTLASWGSGLRNSLFGPLIVLVVFLLGSLIAFPVTVLIVVTALIFGPLLGFFYALTGTLLGAIASYGVGNQLGRNTVRQLTGSRINQLSNQLAKRGVLTVAVIRMVPIAPFTVVNMVAGASHIRFRDFVLGTLLGMGPGTLGLTVFADSVMRAVRNPEPINFAWLAGIMIIIGLGAFTIQRWLDKRNKTKALAAEGGT